MLIIDPHEAFTAMTKATGYKEGDTVRVLRTYQNNEANCGVFWSDWGPDQERFVGKEFKIHHVSDYGEIYLDNDCLYPFFVLERTKECQSVRLSRDYMAIISDDGKTITVGCQTIPYDVIIDLLDTMEDVQRSYVAPPPPVAKKAVKKAVKKVAKR